MELSATVVEGIIVGVLVMAVGGLAATMFFAQRERGEMKAQIEDRTTSFVTHYARKSEMMEEITKTRHQLRNEMQVLGSKLEAQIQKHLNGHGR